MNFFCTECVNCLSMLIRVYNPDGAFSIPGLRDWKFSIPGSRRDWKRTQSRPVWQVLHWAFAPVASRKKYWHTGETPSFLYSVKEVDFTFEAIFSRTKIYDNAEQKKSITIVLANSIKSYYSNWRSSIIILQIVSKNTWFHDSGICNARCRLWLQLQLGRVTLKDEGDWYRLADYGPALAGCRVQAH